MIPVFQTTFGPTSGNCMMACVASVLALGLEEVPSFDPEAGWDAWWTRFIEWCHAREIEVRCCRPQEDYPYWWRLLLDGRGIKLGPQPTPPPGYSILTGLSPRNHATGGLHAVVCLDGELVHDPRGDDPRGVLSIYEWMTLTPAPPRASLAV